MAGLFSDSFKYYIAANKLFSELNDTFGVAYSHCGIGNALRMKGDYSGALLHFRKATTLYRKIGDIVSFSYTLWSLGKTYTMLGKLDKAMDYFKQSCGFSRRQKIQGDYILQTRHGRDRILKRQGFVCAGESECCV